MRPHSTTHPERPYQPASTTTTLSVRRALSRTSNNSAPGPDGISYRLLKILQDTDLGRAVINDIAFNVDHLSPNPPPWEGLKMVMIQKPNKDHTTIKGWRPIVLSNTSSKLGEKCFANRLQSAHQGFHHLQYGSRQNRSATAAMVITAIQIQRELKGGSRVSLLSKDVVSAFNHLRHAPLLERIQAFSPENLEFCRQFLSPRFFQIYWDGLHRGNACMNEGTPQRSPLSPVLWLLFLARTLQRADTAIKDIRLTPTRKSQRLLAPNIRAPPPIQVDLFSYADDVNPVVTTRWTSGKDHARVCAEVDTRLEEAAQADNLSWDPQKDSCITFGEGSLQSTSTLGITINSRLSFQDHVNTRTAKAERILRVMKRLGNSNGGLSPSAMRSLYTGMVRPIFTWGAEVWLHNPLTSAPSRD